MAKYTQVLPDDVIKEFKYLDKNVDNILGEMTKAGAEVVLQNVKVNAPSEIKSHVKTSKVYKTPTDDGVNTKVYFSGYVPFSDTNRKYFIRRGRAGGKSYKTSKGVPAEFIATVTEYGTSTRYTQAGANRGRVIKRPFFRKSFKKKQIEDAMLKAQTKASKGIIK